MFESLRKLGRKAAETLAPSDIYEGVDEHAASPEQFKQTLSADMDTVLAMIAAPDSAQNKGAILELNRSVQNRLDVGHYDTEDPQLGQKILELERALTGLGN